MKLLSLFNIKLTLISYIDECLLVCKEPLFLNVKPQLMVGHFETILISETKEK